VRLPIYRKLDEPFKILGLEPVELGCVSGLFVLAVQFLGATDFGLVISLVTSATLFTALILIKKKAEPACVRKWLRFSQLPDQLHRKLRS